MYLLIHLLQIITVIQRMGPHTALSPPTLPPFPAHTDTHTNSLSLSLCPPLLPTHFHTRRSQPPKWSPAADLHLPPPHYPILSLVPWSVLKFSGRERERARWRRRRRGGKTLEPELAAASTCLFPCELGPRRLKKERQKTLMLTRSGPNPPQPS